MAKTKTKKYKIMTTSDIKKTIQKLADGVMNGVVEEKELRMMLNLIKAQIQVLNLEQEDILDELQRQLDEYKQREL